MKHDRPGSAIGVAVILALAGCGDSSSGGQGTPLSPSPVITAPPPVPSAPGIVTPVTAADLAQAKTVTDRFLAGYLPYRYGRLPASAVKGATVRLRAQLAAAPPGVTPAGRRPRVEALNLVGQSPRAILATATVNDGATPAYPVRLLLGRSRGHWIVAAIQS